VILAGDVGQKKGGDTPCRFLNPDGHSSAPPGPSPLAFVLGPTPGFDRSPLQTSFRYLTGLSMDMQRTAISDLIARN
jgi:hypothetical protein